MSEVVLNLIWLAMVVSAFAALWRFRLAPCIQRRPLAAFLALGCAMALLFPVISVTDDLHSSEYTADEAYSVQKVLKNLQAGQHERVVPVAAALLFFSSAPPDHLLRLIANAVVPVLKGQRAASYADAVPDRAPPALRLATA